MKLKILTYNIHKGFDWNKRNYFLKDIKALVKASGANIVLLQEVVGQSESYKKKGLIDSQFEYIADSVWSHYSYAKNAVHDEGHHGNLVLSEFPIESWTNLNISTNPFEKRGLLVCKIALPSNKKKNKFIYIVCVHLDLLQRGRGRQYKMIKNYFDSLHLPASTPIIFAGDFNDWNRQATKTFEVDLKMTEAYKTKHGHFAKTFPAALPLLTLDRIYVKNMKVLHSEVLPRLDNVHFSDHLPLYTEVQISGA